MSPLSKLKEAFAKHHATEESVLFAGKSIKLVIPHHLNSRAQVRKQVLDAIDNINRNISKIDAEDIKILQGINKIVVSDSIRRSYIDEKTGAYYSKPSELGSVQFESNCIAHESFHVFQYENGGTSASRSTQAEVEAIDFQLRLASALGVSKYEISHLRGYQNDTAAIDRRRRSPW
jgi:hypothetical protein